jgi:hypothetical protein
MRVKGIENIFNKVIENFSNLKKKMLIQLQKHLKTPIIKGHIQHIWVHKIGKTIESCAREATSQV